MYENVKINPTKNTKKISDGMLWHMRIGHASIEYLRKLQKSQTELKDVKFDESIKECEICILAKMENLPFKEIRTRASKPLERIHTDIMGPLKPVSFPGENKYILTFIDDYSRFAKLYSLKNKSQAGECLEKYLQNSRNMLGENKKVCYIRADNAKEYVHGAFLEVMKSEKIDPDFSPVYTKQLNGTAERLNKTLQWKIRSMLLDSGLPPSMWIFAAEAAIHVYNRTPHKSIDFKIPLHVFAPNMKLHVDKLRRFGCKAYAKIPIADSKFSPRAIKTVLVGYSNVGYILWYPPTNKFLCSRNVRFNEKIVYKDEYKSDSEKDSEEIIFEDSESQNEIVVDDESEEIQKRVSEKEKINNSKAQKRKISEVEPVITSRKQPMRKAKEGRDFTIYAKNSEIENSAENSEIELRNINPIVDTSFAYFITINLDKDTIVFRDSYSEIENNVSHDLEEDEIKYALLATVNKDPTSIKEAKLHPDWLKWKGAIEEELNSMVENNVWVKVDRPLDKKEEKKANIIDSRWVFTKKTGENNNLTYKARLVIRGFKDRREYELRETYAPVSRLPLIRAVLAIANKYDFEIYQMDVKAAFLNGDLEDKDIFMEIPEGVETEPGEKDRKMLKIIKALYGLKISPKRWNKKFTAEMIKLGFESDISEPCLFTWRKFGMIIMILLYVDDMLIVGNCLEKIKEIISKLKEIFRMKDLGEPKVFLNMNIKRNRETQTLEINQSEYIAKILERFNMAECKPQNSPMETSQVQKRKIQKNSEYTPKVPYREAIGSLLYLAGASRPDIAYAVNVLSRSQMNPSSKDWEDVKRIFRYLKGTISLGLIYKAKSDDLMATTDASFKDWTDSSSTSGYIITLFDDTIAWRSHKQKSVTKSTCQAEYLAMSEVCDELISLDKAIREITGKTFYPITIQCDNMAAVKNTEMIGSHKLKGFDYSVEVVKENLKFREMTGKRKEMDKTHGDYVKQLVTEGKVKSKWINTKENTADIMTKPLEANRHKMLTAKIINID